MWKEWRAGRNETSSLKRAVRKIKDKTKRCRRGQVQVQEKIVGWGIRSYSQVSLYIRPEKAGKAGKTVGPTLRNDQPRGTQGIPRVQKKSCA